MSKRKTFRNWYEEEESNEKHKFSKKDSKRYDKKRDEIQRARRQKAKQKNSFE